ncbi:RNA-guided endonuclease TnpB family protein [Ilyobacter sp.]|uniref:RNA-guided endonuclease TnpB family protein n=1 Tax=Ilyobacter sp. TaxID=3100343 RepID=UPI0035692600
MKSYLIEIKPIEEQKQKIHQNIGNCRVVYNLYLKKLISKINKTIKVKKLEKKLKRIQKRLSRKNENKKIGGETTNKNILKAILNLQKIHFKLSNIRTEYIRFVVNSMVKNNPQFITIEDLNIKGMMKNKHLSKSIAKQKWYYLILFLKAQANKRGIQIRQVDRWYPSSKICNNCGSLKTELKLRDRKYICGCGYIEDRDLNASFNLRDANEYKIAN